jgi:putative ABC transport system ATP-binding protein
MFNLLPTLTALENVSLPRSLDGHSERRARTAAEKALEEVELAHRASHYPAQLSGGEMQRVAIARAVVIEPELLVADEPTGSLDSITGQRVLALLRRLNQERGLTILLATHAEEAASLAGRQIRIRDGRIEPTASNHVPAATV